MTEIETSWSIEDIMQADALFAYEGDLSYLKDRADKRRNKR